MYTAYAGSFRNCERKALGMLRHPVERVTCARAYSTLQSRSWRSLFSNAERWKFKRVILAWCSSDSYSSFSDKAKRLIRQSFPSTSRSSQRTFDIFPRDFVALGKTRAKRFSILHESRNSASNKGSLCARKNIALVAAPHVAKEVSMIRTARGYESFYTLSRDNL